ncbi:hypothetical protein WJX74_000828 [Apatococcus lobatus]|uniref:Uncharacterized protein n=1 Tax=Apatococcus lobatus TaxID=904363 RepID=A0AAW1QBI0_9CHLO
MLDAFDPGTGATWRTAASQVLALETIPQSVDGTAVQTRLRQQAHALKNLLSGRTSPPNTHNKVLGSLRYGDWSPCDPKDGLCHYFRCSTTLIPCHSRGRPGSNTWRPTLELPAPAAAELPLELDEHFWCLDGAGDTHLVYSCVMQEGSLPTWSAFNTRTCLIVAQQTTDAVHYSYQRPQSSKASHDCRKLTLPLSDSEFDSESDHRVLILHLPSLVKAFQIAKPTILQNEAHIQIMWAGWSPATTQSLSGGRV